MLANDPPYRWQTVSNVIALVTGSIAAGLYGNIGLSGSPVRLAVVRLSCQASVEVEICSPADTQVLGSLKSTLLTISLSRTFTEVFYVNIVEELFKGPPLMSHGGRMLWSILTVVFWALAFVIGTAIPGVGSLSGLVAAVCIFQCTTNLHLTRLPATELTAFFSRPALQTSPLCSIVTYTFPPLLMLGLDMSIDAALADEPFTTPGVVPTQVDTWRQAVRLSLARTITE